MQQSVLEETKTSVHEFSCLLDSYACPTSDIISNIESREECFIKPLTFWKDISRDKDSKYSFFLPDWIIPEKSFEISFTKKESPQIGQIEELSYYIKTQDLPKLFLTKKYKCVLFELFEGLFNVGYEISEEIHNGDRLSNSSYSLLFNIREADFRTYIYAKIEFDSNSLYPSLFNKEIQDIIVGKINNLSYDRRYFCTYTSIESVLINAPRERVFSFACDISAFKGCESIYNSESGDVKKTKLEAVGDKYKLHWITLDIYMEFEVVEMHIPNCDEDDYVLTRHLYYSKPEQIKFDYSHILKKVDDNTTLVVFKFVYDSTVKPEFMSCLKKDKIITLIMLKKLSEEQ